MFNFLKMHKSGILCSALLCLGVMFSITSCSPLADVSSQNDAEKKLLKVGSPDEGSDVFVLSCLSDLISGFDYNLYEDSACTNKTLYNTASYFMYIGNDKYYFSNVYEYNAVEKTLVVEVIKNGQMDKEMKNFIFSSTNNSSLTTLKLTGISAAMNGTSIEVFENEFKTTNYKDAWNKKSADYNSIGTLYYKQKTDFTNAKALPDFGDKQYYLLDGEGNYVKTFDNKDYAVKFTQYDIERKNHSQNLYQITSDNDYYYFGFSVTAKDSYNNALIDNYLSMPAICRVKFNQVENKITISDSKNLSKAKPSLKYQDWNDTEYTITETAPAPTHTPLPDAQDKSLEEMQALAKSMTGGSDGTQYWKKVNNPIAENSEYYYQFWFGTLASTNVTANTTAKEYFNYLRLKGMKRGTGKYNNNTATQPADDLYTDEIFTDGTSIYVFGHLAVTTGPAAPKGAVYAPNNADTGKYALWVISQDGIKTSQLFDSLDDCKNGSYNFKEFTWQ